MAASPFLFAAGYVLDYQFVVCPRRLAQGDRVRAFRRWVSGLLKQVTEAPQVAITDDPLLQNVVLVYACGPAKINGAAAQDVGRRRVNIVWGFAFDRAERQAADFEARARKLFRDETPKLLQMFERFWDSREPIEAVSIDLIDDAREALRWPCRRKSLELPSRLRAGLAPLWAMPRAGLIALLLASVGVNGIVIAVAVKDVTMLKADKAHLQKENEGWRKVCPWP